MGVPVWTLVATALLAAGALFAAVRTHVRARDRLARLTRQAHELEAAKADLAEAVSTLNAMNTDLRQSEARYKGLMDGHGDVLIRKSPEGRLTFVNDIFCATFGVEREGVLDTAFQPKLHPENAGAMLGTLGGGGAGPLRVRYDQCLETVDGWRWFAWEEFPVRDSEGRLLEIQSMGRDITDRKQTEKALTRARDMAEAASRSKSLFLATMSHEIRTPMNGILGMTGLLLKGPLTAAQRHYAEMVQESGEALLNLINDILDFSKIESGAIELESIEFAPDVLTETVCELLATRTRAKGIVIATVIAPDLPAIMRGDESRLRQVLLNLAGNAVKFTETGGVTVRAGLVEGRTDLLRFEIEDTGIGIPDEARERIFDMFAQADSSHARKFGGTGLGLAISKRIVAAMGGEIGVSSVPGQGSTFWFTVRLDPVSGAAVTDRVLEDETVLVVSATAVQREALARQITVLGGKVETLDPSVSEGFAGDPHRESRKPVTAVLYDWDEEAGPAANTLLDRNGGADARRICLLGADERAQERRILDQGFSACLIKPIRRATLVAAITRDASVEGHHSEAPGHGPDEHPSAVGPATSGGLRVVGDEAQHSADGEERAAKGGARILLAEDNDINALLALSLLERTGHDVTRVTSGAEVIPALEQGTFDLILMDIHMPGTDGLEATLQVRADSRFAAIPIVALTANAMTEDRSRCLAAGMDDFLTKPMTPEDLYGAVAKWTASRDTPENTPGTTTGKATGKATGNDRRTHGGKDETAAAV